MNTAITKSISVAVSLSFLLILYILPTSAEAALNTSKRFSSIYSGRIIVDSKSQEAYYVNPGDLGRVYLGESEEALSILLSLSIGISNKDFKKIPLETEKRIGNKKLLDRLLGSVIVKVQDKRKAYYINPITRKAIPLITSDDAERLINNAPKLGKRMLERIALSEYNPLLEESSDNDTDEDGITDFDEISLGTSPFRAEPEHATRLRPIAQDVSPTSTSTSIIPYYPTPSTTTPPIIEFPQQFVPPIQQLPLATSSIPVSTPTTTLPQLQPQPSPTPTPAPQGIIGPFPQGATLFVDADNTSGIEDGSSTKPFNTIQEAINIAQAGTVIGVGAGTYRESITLKSGINLIGYDKTITIIDGGNDFGDVVKIEKLYNVRVSGFTIRGAISGQIPGGAGILVNYPSASIGIDNNIITANSSGIGVMNAYLGSGGPVIDRNIIIRNSINGIWDPGTGIISNNVIAYNGLWGIVKGLNSVSSFIVNNSIINNSGDGIRLTDDRVSTIKNNIISGNGGFGINVKSGNSPFAKRPLATYNLFFQNTTGNFSEIDSPVGNDSILNTAVEINSIPGNANNIVGDPKISNPSAGDYHITNGSMAIDAGNIIDSPSLDYEGDVRPADGDSNGTALIDIGADEAGAGTSAPRDTVPPTISAAQATNIAQTSATITWTTNEPSTSDVVFALVSLASAASTTRVTGSANVISHSINLTNLGESKTYYYAVVSADSMGNAATSSEQSFTTLAPPLPVSSWSNNSLGVSGGYQSIAWNGNGYGAVYGWNGKLYFAKLDSNGNKLNEAIISTAPNYVFWTNIIWNGSKYGVAWYESNPSNLRFATMDIDGNTLSNIPITIDNDNVSSERPALIWTGNEFALAWSGGWPDYPVYFAKIAADGQTFTVNKKKSITTATARAANGPIVSLAWNGANFGVAWQDIRDSGDSNSPALYFNVLDSNGNKLTAFDVKVSGSGRAVGSPQIFSDGSNYIVFWRESTAADVNANSIYAAKLDSAGNKVLANQNLNTKGDNEIRPSVVKTDSGYGIIWTSFPEQKLYFKSINSSASIVVDNEPVSMISGSNDNAFVVWRSNKYGVAWSNQSQLFFGTK